MKHMQRKYANSGLFSLFLVSGPPGVVSIYTKVSQVISIAFLKWTDWILRYPQHCCSVEKTNRLFRVRAWQKTIEMQCRSKRSRQNSWLMEAMQHLMWVWSRHVTLGQGAILGGNGVIEKHYPEHYIFALVAWNLDCIVPDTFTVQ